MNLHWIILSSQSHRYFQISSLNYESNMWPVESRSDPDLTLKVGLVSSVWPVADHHTGRVNHDLPAAPKPGMGLPRAPALLQSQGEQVVMAKEADQDPLPDVHPLAGEPQGMGPVTKVGTNRDVTLHDLKERRRYRRIRTLTFPAFRKTFP